MDPRCRVAEHYRRHGHRCHQPWAQFRLRRPDLAGDIAPRWRCRGLRHGPWSGNLGDIGLVRSACGADASHLALYRFQDRRWPVSLYLAYRLWRGARTPLVLADTDVADGWSGTWFRLSVGNATQQSESCRGHRQHLRRSSSRPRASLMYFAIPPIIMTTETSWYAIVAVIVSAERPRGVYARWKAWIDRLARNGDGGTGIAIGRRCGNIPLTR